MIILKKNDQYTSDLFMNVFNDTPYGILVMDDRVIIDANKEACRLLQYDDKSELIGLSPQSISPERQINGVLSVEQAKINFRKGLKDGHNEFDWLHVRKDGEIIWVHVVLKKLVNFDSIMVGYWQDITEQRKLENRFRNFMENIPASAYIKDENLRYTYLNNTAINNLKVDERKDSEIEYKGLTAEDIYPQELAEWFTKSDLELIKNRKQLEEVIYTTPNGEERWTRSFKFIYKDADLRDYIGGLSFDITELMEAKNKTEEIKESLLTTIQSLTESRDPFTAGHELRVSSLAVEIGKRFGMNGDRLEGLRIASLLHDVGKIYLPLELLSKPGLLTHKQMMIIKEHVQIGSDLLKDVTFELPICEIILQHHEYIDGTGYPRGLKGEDILLEAKIIRVADVFEAMSHHRPYRPRRKDQEVIDELQLNKDTKYDSKIVDICIDIMKSNLHNLEGWKN